uniref:Serine/threonine-protein phosphatase PGAM5, mitochondrial n=1 Tax=Timema poppense TaxID=170557 RepID=A0A7R9DE42_TIMPO|nr:unnamed protein product [Timema poppensis]
MRKFTRLHKIIAGALGLGAGPLVWHFAFRKDDGSPGFANKQIVYSKSVSGSWDFDWDKRDPKSLVPPPRGGEQEENKYNEALVKHKPRVTRNLFLIRHGEYNVNGKTDEDRGLTERGRQQAQLTGKRLKEVGYPFDKIYRSTMTRANETSNIIEQFYPNIPVEDCSMLREGMPIPPDPPSGSGNWKPEVYYYTEGPRIEAAFRKYFHRAYPNEEKDTYDLIVCHANVIRYFICRALQLPPEAWLRLSLPHGSITWIVIRPNGRVSLRCFGDTGYMPPEALSV